VEGQVGHQPAAAVVPQLKRETQTSAERQQQKLNASSLIRLTFYSQ
jgi:hypothetical protein